MEETIETPPAGGRGWARRAGGWALRLVLYGLAFTLLAVTVAGYLGFTVTVRPRMGSTAETSLLRFTGEPEPPFENDFPAGERPRNVVLLIADGLGIAHLVAARSELVGIDGRLVVERFPVSGWLASHSQARLYTDSGASATALATGRKTEPLRLSTSADDAPLRTLLEAAHDRGLATGLVTDSYLWDATPGAFASHVASRRDYGLVAEQMATAGVEVVAGEVDEDFDPENAEHQRRVEVFREAGYAVARAWDEAQPAADDRRPLAFLFDPGVVSDRERQPSLARLAELALERLAADPEGFFLMVETEETDTASHYHEFARMVRGVEAIDSVAGRMLEHARQDRSTLIVFTADHETGGLTLLSGSTEDKLGIAWMSYDHTGAPVPILAYGPGAERFAGVRDNTEVGRILAELLGVELETGDG